MVGITWWVSPCGHGIFFLAPWLPWHLSVSTFSPRLATIQSSGDPQEIRGQRLMIRISLSHRHVSPHFATFRQWVNQWVNQWSKEFLRNLGSFWWWLHEKKWTPDGSSLDRTPPWRSGFLASLGEMLGMFQTLPSCSRLHLSSPETFLKKPFLGWVLDGLDGLDMFRYV